MNAPMPVSSKGIVPFVYDDVAALAGWRENLHWPVAQPEIVSVGARVPGAILTFIGGLTDPQERHVAIVSAGLFAGGFMSLLEAAWTAERSRTLGLDILGGPPEIPLLAHGRSDFKALEYRGPFGVKPAPRAFLRGVARTSSWTPAWRLPLALMAPEAVAVSHNHLLRQAALDRRLVFRHAANIVMKARARHAAVAQPSTGLVDRVLDALLPLSPDLGDMYRDRLRQAFRARLGNAVGRVAADVAALGTARLPRHLWSGTNGDYATRLIAAEARRRGFTVDVFDHGGVSGISQLSGSTALIELCTASRFHVATPEWARLVSATDAPSLAAAVNRAEIVGEKGEPLFRRCFRDRTEPLGAKKRVIYVGHPYRGLRQFPLAGLPDVVYWDFQMHLVALLQEFGVDLLCKPHPEGHFIGKRNPIEALAPTSYRRFEEHLDDADLFLFDAPTSTTFVESLCTRRPVVLIDRFYAINPAVRPAIEARCRIVPARADAQNRLRVDADALRAAILDAPREGDPDYFRRLTAGAPA